MSKEEMASGQVCPYCRPERRERHVESDAPDARTSASSSYEPISAAIDGDLRGWIEELSAFLDVEADSVVAVALGRLREDHGGSDVSFLRINDEIIDYARTNGLER